MHYLPSLLTRLIRKVDWNEEGACFSGICRIIASFYVKCVKDSTKLKPVLGPNSGKILQNSPESSDGEEKSDIENRKDDQHSSSWSWTVEHVLLPAIRTILLPTHTMCFPTNDEKSTALLNLTSLPELYKVFERC